MSSGLTRRAETGFPKRTCDNKEIWGISRFYLIGKCSRWRVRASKSPRPLRRVTFYGV
jgi:hypothetical protein